MHQSSLDKMAAFRNEYLRGREDDFLHIVDLGSCDVNGSYKRFFDYPNWKYTGIDMISGNNVDIVLADPYNWYEIDSSTVDILISGQAFEHIEFFWLTMLEISRVLKPDGLCCIIAPSGGIEHKYPVDCWRFYADGFAALARYCGLEILKVHTQWESLGYKDDSDSWKDSVLICRKPMEQFDAQGHKGYTGISDKLEKYDNTGQVNAGSFNPSEYSTALVQEPLRLTNVTDWHDHIPFAFAIVEMLRPKVFVELGTHMGDSYCSFCQTIKSMGIDSVSYAVDTWQGDEHTGPYDSSVYDALKAYHDPLYGKFSTLLRCRFDEALKYFSDGSIDLLHIDGLHTYEAVKHDFETWLPKMSDRGVMLFHDTNVRERGFGVWKLWEEIRDGYPSFEFRYGHGLGIIAVGSNIPEALRQFLSMKGRDAALVSNYFHKIGRQIRLKTHIARLDERIAELEERIAELEPNIAEKNRQIENVLNSYSWKMSAPLRTVLRLFR